MDYALAELLGNGRDAEALEGGTFVTLRLTSAMYQPVPRAVRLPGDPGAAHFRRPLERQSHRPCAACDGCSAATSGWSSKRWLPDGRAVTLVAVAAILVSGIRLGFMTLREGRRPLRDVVKCDLAFQKGDELGWFEHGSTIIVLGRPGLAVIETLQPGDRIRMGQKLLRLSHPYPGSR